MSDTQVADSQIEFERVKTLFKKWIQDITPILKQVKEEGPSDLAAMMESIRVKAETSNEEYEEGIIQIFKNLGVDTNTLEDKLRDTTGDEKEIMLAFHALETSNPMIHELENLLIAELSRSEAVKVLIQFTLDAGIQLAQLALTKMEDESLIAEFQNLATQMVGIEGELNNETLSFIKAWLRDFVNSAQNIKDSSPADFGALRQEIERSGVEGLHLTFQYSIHGLIITPATICRNQSADSIPQEQDGPLTKEFKRLSTQIVTDGLLHIFQAIENHLTTQE